MTGSPGRRAPAAVSHRPETETALASLHGRIFGRKPVSDPAAVHHRAGLRPDQLAGVGIFLKMLRPQSLLADGRRKDPQECILPW
jgi:hypothetical protein